MTIYETIKNYITKEPRGRERKYKNRVIGNILFKQYGIEIQDKEKMSDMVGEILSADRAWRKCLEENPELRGTDYLEKTELEIKKQIELGYNL